MNRNRKSCLFLLVIAISPIVLFLLYLFINSFFSRTETYYIPQLDMYVKTIIKTKDKYGYVLFGDNPNLILSDSTDYIGVHTNISNSVLINLNKDTIWFCSQIKQNEIKEGEYTVMNRAKEIKQKKFVIIDGTNETDSIFFNGKDSFGIKKVKNPYIKISVIDNFYYILVRQDSTTVRIEPL